MRMGLDEHGLVCERVPSVDDVPEVGATFATGVLETANDVCTGGGLEGGEVRSGVFGVEYDPWFEDGEESCLLNAVEHGGYGGGIFLVHGHDDVEAVGSVV